MRRSTHIRNDLQKRVVIAGLRGGGGKTTLSLGLTAALHQRGLRVAPFKKGPDYIDAGWLSAAAGGAPCHNLDHFLIGEQRVLDSFVHHAAGSDISVIEGNRGLFDGMDAEGSFSTARLSRIIKAPIVLIVDCTKSTRTVAALVLGARKLERGLKLAGVVLNQLSGKRHENVTREAVEKYAGVPVLGAIPKLREADLPERHMGLLPIHEHGSVQRMVSTAAELIERYVDVKRIIEISSAVPRLSGRKTPLYEEAQPKGQPVRIGVIRDSAFQFYYPENIEALRRLGAEVLEFSALTESALPVGLDALYIGGGFPETHAIELAGNLPFRESLKRAALGGLPIYAECGGLMYLGQRIVTEGGSHEMSGILPLSFKLNAKPRAHGYTILKSTKKNPFYRQGTVLRGHEFHYSEVTDDETPPLALRNERGRGIKDGRDGVTMHKVLAMYTHVHALGTPQWATGIVQSASEAVKKK